MKATLAHDVRAVDVTRARVSVGQAHKLPGRTPRYTSYLVIERGDPADERFERLEVPIEVGITKEHEAFVGEFEHRAWRNGSPCKVSRALREDAHVLLLWIFYGQQLGLTLITDPCVSSITRGDLLATWLRRVGVSHV